MYILLRTIFTIFSLVLLSIYKLTFSKYVKFYMHKVKETEIHGENKIEIKETIELDN